MKKIIVSFCIFSIILLNASSSYANVLGAKSEPAATIILYNDTDQDYVVGDNIAITSLVRTKYVAEPGASLELKEKVRIYNIEYVEEYVGNNLYLMPVSHDEEDLINGGTWHVSHHPGRQNDGGFCGSGYHLIPITYFQTIQANSGRCVGYVFNPPTLAGGEVWKYEISDVVISALTSGEVLAVLDRVDASYRIGDASGDGEVTIYDAALIVKYALGLIDKFPVEE